MSRSASSKLAQARCTQPKNRPRHTRLLPSHPPCMNEARQGAAWLMDGLGRALPHPSRIPASPSSAAQCGRNPGAFMKSHRSPAPGYARPAGRVGARDRCWVGPPWRFPHANLDTGKTAEGTPACAFNEAGSPHRVTGTASRHKASRSGNAMRQFRFLDGSSDCGAGATPAPQATKTPAGHLTTAANSSAHRATW